MAEMGSGCWLEGFLRRVCFLLFLLDTSITPCSRAENGCLLVNTLRAGGFEMSHPSLLREHAGDRLC